MMLDHRIVREAANAEEIASALRRKIVAYDVEQSGEEHGDRIVLTARNGAGDLLGGLIAFGFWNGLFIDVLWVEELQRGRGIGRSLMYTAEARARATGREVCFLSSWASQAPDFYRKLGYAPFGELTGMRRGEARTWFAKWLEPPKAGG